MTTAVRRAVTIVAVAVAMIGSALAPAGSAAGAGESAGTPAAVVALPEGPALSAVADPSWWVTNGRVDDIVSDGHSAWIAGGFDDVGPSTGRAVLTVAASGERIPPLDLRVDGTVAAAVSDGVGGFYLAGSFVRVGDLRREGVAHVDAQGHVDADFRPQVAGTVYALALVAGRLVVAGDVTSVGGAPVSRIAALDPRGRLVPGWSAQVDGTVRSLRSVGASVYVGGRFGTVDGVARANLARISAVTGALEPSFAVGTNGGVRSIDVVPGATREADLVWFGGDFSAVSNPAGSAPRLRLANSTGSGSLLPWAPSVAGVVGSVAVSPDQASIAVGGTFTAVAGVARTGVVVLGRDGTVKPLAVGVKGCQQPHTVQNTNQLVPCTPGVATVAWSGDGTQLYAGGLFTTTQGVMRHNAAAYDVATGAVAAWQPMPSALVLSVTPLPSGVLLGGEFTSAGGVYRQSVAKIDLSTGRADPGFSADTDDVVVDLELDATQTSLFLAGSFRTVGGVARNKVAKVSALTGAVDPVFRVGANKDVRSIAVRGGALYLGGLFTRIGQDPRAHAARVSTETGAADAVWRADTSGPGGVRKDGAVLSVAVAPDASRVFLAGGFTGVNGLAVDDGVVAVDGGTGAVDPSRLGGLLQLPTVRCATSFVVRLQLSTDGSRLYGGDLCPDGLYAWDAIGLAASHPDGLVWATWCNGGMQGRLQVGERFYLGSHGGDRGKGGSCWTSPGTRTTVPATRAMAFATATGDLQDWAPFFDSPMGVWAYAVVPQGLLVGGDFTLAGDRTAQQQGLALFRGTP